MRLYEQFMNLLFSLYGRSYPIGPGDEIPPRWHHARRRHDGECSHGDGGSSRRRVLPSISAGVVQGMQRKRDWILDALAAQTGRRRTRRATAIAQAGRVRPNQVLEKKETPSSKGS